jgi:hypothetical protein
VFSPVILQSLLLPSHCYKTSPNSKFADIKAIKEAQIAAGDREIEEEDSDSSVDTTNTGDCIEVQD